MHDITRAVTHTFFDEKEGQDPKRSGPKALVFLDEGRKIFKIVTIDLAVEGNTNKSPKNETFVGKGVLLTNEKGHILPEVKRTFRDIANAFEQHGDARVGILITRYGLPHRPVNFRNGH